MDRQKVGFLVSCASLPNTYSLCVCIFGNTLYISLQTPLFHSRWDRADIKDKDCFSKEVESSSLFLKNQDNDDCETDVGMSENSWN